MKITNKVSKICFALVLALCMVLFCSPIRATAATQASVIWNERISTFKKLNRLTRGSCPYYTKVFQKVMYYYSTSFRDDINMHGGIDGDFFTAAERCAKEFQRLELPEYETEKVQVNGTEVSVTCVGPATWYAIGNELADDEGSYYMVFIKGGVEICRATLDSPYVFKYYEIVNGNDTWTEFHTTY